MNIAALGILVLAIVSVVLVVVRIVRKGPDSGLPRCSTCLTRYAGCPCDRPATRAPDTDEEDEDA